MSVSLYEVLTAAGYNVKNNPEDAQWFLAQESDIDDLTYDAEQCVDDYEEYESYVDAQNDEGVDDDDIMDFEMWREENK